MSNLSFCTTVEECGPASACSNGKCDCDEFWSTDMDFLNFETCATSIIAMYILWALNLLLIIYVLYKSTTIILMRFENFFEQRKTKRNYTLWQNKGLIAVILEFGISIPAQSAMAILHFVEPTARIGFDLLPTLLFFISKFGFYACIIFVQGPLLAVTLKGDPSKRHIVRMGYISNTFSSVLAIIIGGIPFLTYTSYQNPGDEGQQLIVMQSYYFCQTITMCINLCMALMVIKKVNEAFDQAEGLVVSNEKNKNNNIRQKVNDLQKSSAKQAAIQGTIYLLMGAIPFFYTRHAYFLPISWLAMPLLGMKLAHQVSLDKRGAKTIMQRLGIKKTSTTGGDKVEQGSSVMGDTATNKQLGTLLSPMSSQGGRRLQSSVVSEATQMEEILHPDHPSHKAFMEYVKSRFATSELELLEQLLLYKRATTLKERTKIGNNIMKKYIVDGAPHQVDIPDGIKKILESTAAKKMFVEGTFDSVRGPLIFDIKGNFFAPFEKKMSMNTFSEENI